MVVDLAFRTLLVVGQVQVKVVLRQASVKSVSEKTTAAWRARDDDCFKADKMRMFSYP